MPGQTLTSPILRLREIGKIVIITLIVLLLLAALNTTVLAEPEPPAGAYVAIIIDDMGFKLKQDKRALNLPGNVTLAFLPYTPHVRELAETAHSQGNEIMLHLPMQALETLYHGPGGLDKDMNREEFKISLLKSILAVPHVKGINNHMGSLITSQQEPMQWLMEEVARTRLFFVDSRTTPETLAEQTAGQYQIANTRRNIFLDHEHDRSAIEQQFNNLIKLAKKNGTALAIGHPFNETLAVLEEQIPRLKAAGIQLVPVSELIRQQHHWQQTQSLTLNNHTKQ